MANDGLKIPSAMRAAIYERDRGYCRMCGEFPSWYEVHHIIFGGDARGMGGRREHNVDEMVSLCHSCHSFAHSRKTYWQPILLRVIQRPGVTGFQLARWQRVAESKGHGAN